MIYSPTTTSSCSIKSFAKQYLPFITSYLVFGLIHELSHVVIASILLGPSLTNNPFATFDNLYHFIVRALLGRYCLIEVGNDDDVSSVHHLVIRHFGWIFSIVIAMGLHCYHRRHRQNSSNVKDMNKISSSLSSLLADPIIVVAAYVTAFEAITTDLFSFVPIFGQDVSHKCDIPYNFFWIYDVHTFL